jgi:molecular chaperone GrpE (heat shock protein)
MVKWILSYLGNTVSWIKHQLLKLLSAYKAAPMEASPTQPKSDSEHTAGWEDAEWKGAAIADFQQWLSELPDEPPPTQGVDMVSCDLYTLLNEFVALRQEIKMQNREQHKTLQIQQSLIDTHKAVMTIFSEKSRQLDALEERIRRHAEMQALTPFFEVRDALQRGLQAGRKRAATKRWFRRANKDMTGILEGYEMAIRRFDRALAQVGIHPVETVGHAFDSTVMKAVGTRTDSGAEPGIVLEEQLGGLIRGETLLRTAQVIVNTQT